MSAKIGQLNKLLSCNTTNSFFLRQKKRNLRHLPFLSSNKILRTFSYEVK